MRDKKPTKQTKNLGLSWNTTEEIYRATKIIAPMYGQVLNHFPAYCCKKWLHNPVYVIDEKARPRCVTVYVDADLRNSLNDAASSYALTCSEIIHACVKREVYAQIAKWGCRTPQHFVDLMTSQTPLEILGEVIADLNTVLIA